MGRVKKKKQMVGFLCSTMWVLSCIANRGVTRSALHSLLSQAPSQSRLFKQDLLKENVYEQRLCSQLATFLAISAQLGYLCSFYNVLSLACVVLAISERVKISWCVQKCFHHNIFLTFLLALIMYPLIIFPRVPMVNFFCTRTKNCFQFTSKANTLLMN